jgi:hypothetical protein
MQEIINATIQSRSVAENHLHITKKFIANPSCNTFHQEKCQNMPRKSSFNKCASQFQPNNPSVTQISDLTND